MTTIAIVGRPNVGKSRLFNALLKKRIAIVLDQPGVTRDANTAELAPGLTLVDTGGWGMTQMKTSEQSSPLDEAVEEQVEVAIQAADQILFVVDGRAGVTSLDDQIAAKLRPYKDKVTLIINKVDQADIVIDEGEFIRLGLARWQLISAEHGRGIEGIRNTLLKFAPKEQPPLPANRRPNIAIVGRPNVGKSSLTNALLKKYKVIVSPISGTTRDPVMLPLDYTNKKGEKYAFNLIDTAGLRHRTKVDSPVEVFSQMRARQSLEKADVALLVIDALDGVTVQDKQLAGDIQQAGKPIIIVVNKWDKAVERFQGEEKIEGFDTLQDFEAECRDNIEEALFFTAGAAIIFLSAQQDKDFDKLLKTIKAVEGVQDKTFSTPEVNKVLETLTWKNVPRNVSGKMFKIYYATQTGTRPYYIKLFCNQDEGVADSFKRYLAKGFSNHFKVGGCPFFFHFISKPRRVRETPTPVEQQKKMFAQKMRRKSKKTQGGSTGAKVFKPKNTQGLKKKQRKALPLRLKIHKKQGR